MTKEELLATISTEELAAELERRKKIEREEKERNQVSRCRMCKHYASVDCYGNPRTEPLKPWEARCCPFAKSKRSRKRLLCLSGSELACENFIKKDL